MSDIITDVEAYRLLLRQLSEALAMSDIVEMLKNAAKVEEYRADIERLRNNYSILKRDYDALRADNEHLRTTLGYLADNIDNPALVAVAEAALVRKP